MSLTVETGVGVQGADSYASVAAIATYWANRQHNALFADWDAAGTSEREGAAREASGYIDATFATRFRGVRRGYVQGLQWPRSGALDDAGYPLPDLPPELVTATCELAARALSGSLAADVKAGGGIIKRVKADTVEVEFADNGRTTKSYPAVEAMLTALLQPTSEHSFAIAGC